MNKVKQEIIGRLKESFPNTYENADTRKIIDTILTEELSKLNPNRIDEERFVNLFNKHRGKENDSFDEMHTTMKEYNSTLPEPLVRLPTEMPKELEDNWDIHTRHAIKMLWKNIIKHYGTPQKAELPSVDSSIIQPEPMKAGDKRVSINGSPVLVDFRIVAEDYYQEYFIPKKEEWWMKLKEGDKVLIKSSDKVYKFVDVVLKLSDGSNFNLFPVINNCSPYTEPSMRDKIKSLGATDEMIDELLKEEK